MTLQKWSAKRWAVQLTATFLIIWCGGMGARIIWLHYHQPSWYLSDLSASGATCPAGWTCATSMTQINPVPVRHFSTPPPVLRPPVDHPPLKLVLGAYTYHVRFTTTKYLDLNGAYAYTNTGSKEIWLDGESIKDIRENLLHELMHAALDGHQPLPRDYIESENTFIQPMAPDLLEALRNNPGLAEWLVRR